MNKLKRKLICEFIIILNCMFTIIIYILGLIKPKVYFSNFLLSTIQVIFAGVILIFMLPLYFRDFKIFDENRENDIRKVYKPFWRYCILISMIICIISLVGFMVLWILVLLLNLPSIILNVAVTILANIALICFGIIIVIVVVREIKFKFK